ncbi:MAG: DUF4446 family protein [Candidatus Paceibacterota bacterium]
MNIQLDNIFLMGFFVLAGLIMLVGILWAFNTEKRLKRFFLGKKAKDLEDTILHLENQIARLEKWSKDADGELSTINNKLKKSVRGIATMRFNPFTDQGSNQSFAIGMLDEEGDGVVLSSLYSRERMSVFAKPVKGGKSEYDLTREEKEVLVKAKVL